MRCQLASRSQMSGVWLLSLELCLSPQTIRPSGHVSPSGGQHEEWDVKAHHFDRPEGYRG